MLKTPNRTSAWSAVPAARGDYRPELRPERILAYQFAARRLRWEVTCRLALDAVRQLERLLASVLHRHPHDHSGLRPLGT
jgi:hypothetical protein